MILPTVVSLLLLSASTAVRASPCVAFDINWNLLAFDLDGKDWSAGTQATWSSGQAAEITTSGRPPFTGVNTTCYLSQYTNAVYVLNGDAEDLSAIYIYDATTKSWSTQAVTTGAFDPNSFAAVLDHDTNNFYAISQGSMFYLNMGLLSAANSTALTWTDAEQTPYPSGYQPLIALANNHLFMLNVPGVAPGSADIFVIHYSWFQPTPQAFPLTNGGTFPSTFGHTASFFQTDNTVQQFFAFIPQDSSATYIVNVMTNTTDALPGPTIKDPLATYYAANTSLVQLASDGTVSYITYQADDATANSGAAWSVVHSLASSAPPSASTASASGTPTASGNNPAATSSSNKTSGAMTSNTVQMGLVLATLMGVVASLL